MIRVIRHAARTGFAIDRRTYQAIIEHRDEIKKCSPSRVRDEFLRDLKEGAAQPSLDLMLQTGLLFSLFPDFHRVFGDRNPAKRKDAQLCLIPFRSRRSIGAGSKTGPGIHPPRPPRLPFVRSVIPEHPFLGRKGAEWLLWPRRFGGSFIR